MSAWLSAFRVTAVAASAFAWASACGSGDTSSSTPQDHCFIYFGAGNTITPPQPDAGQGCPPGVCDYQSQTGCATGENCFPHYDEKSNTVVPACGAAGAQESGQACGATGQLCARGLICVDGACAKACCAGDSSACGESERCIRQAVAFKTASGATIAYDEGLGTCAKVNDCSLLDPGACKGDPRRSVCRIVDVDGTVACSKNGDRGIGEDCDTDHQCGPGQHCAGNTIGDTVVQTRCVRLCKFGSCGGEPSCGADEGVCVHFDRDPDGVGECTPDWHGPGVEVDGGAPSAGTHVADAAVDGR